MSRRCPFHSPFEGASHESCSARHSAAAAGLLIALAACGGGDDESGAPPASAVVGAAGGTVTGPNGAKVEIPPGALGSDTTIAIEATSAGSPLLPDGFSVAGRMFAFTPHGTTFKVPVTVTLPFDPASVPAGRAPALYKTTGANQWLQVRRRKLRQHQRDGTDHELLMGAGQRPAAQRPGARVGVRCLPRQRRRGSELRRRDAGRRAARTARRVSAPGWAISTSSP